MSATTYYGMELVESPHVAEDSAWFTGKIAPVQVWGRRAGKSFTESALREAIAKLQHDNPNNPRYAVINPKAMAMLKNLRWNEPEHLSFDDPNLGKRMFHLLDQEERKWQDLFARQYI